MMSETALSMMAETAVMDQGGDRLLKEKHHKLAGVVKGVHAKLRERFHQSGNIDEVWKEHCQDDSTLSEYADAMHHLATEIWTKNPETRIDWCRKTCLEYFFHGGLQKVLDKQDRRQKFAKTNQDKEHKENLPAARTRRHRSKSEERLASMETQETWSDDRSVPSIHVLSASANQVRGYLCQPTSESKSMKNENGGLTADKQILSISSDGTSIMDEASSQESVGQNGGACAGVKAAAVVVCAAEMPAVDDKVQMPRAESGGVYESSAMDVDLIFGYPDGLEPESCGMPIARPNAHQYNTITLPFDGKIHLLDVGSCFNAFQQFDEFQALGVDISPAVESVYVCDFLYLETTDPLQLAPDSVGTFLRNLKSPIEVLPSETFHVVVFSLLLEYFPCTYQRWICCQKAQQLLTVNGILIIVTPDSHHQNRNAPMIKSWKKAIESLGFSRWRYVKLEHLHCMVFRKLALEQRSHDQNSVLVKDVGPDMLYIPQDFHDQQQEEKSCTYLFGSVPQSEDGDCSFMNNIDELPGFVGSI